MMYVQNLLAGITWRELKRQPEFARVLPELNAWFNTHLRGRTAGVLVSHNNATDIQFLLCEYLRAGSTLPKKIHLALDTLATIKRYSTLCYRKANVNEWPAGHLTKAGKPSMGVKPCAIYALRHRDPPENIEDVCGTHHDANADTKMVAVCLFDFEQFGRHGLYHCVFKAQKRCFRPLSECWTEMQKKMQEPILKFESPPPGWVLAEVVTSTENHLMVTTLTNICLMYSLKMQMTPYRQPALHYLKA